MNLTASCCSKPNITSTHHAMYANAEGNLFFWKMQGFDRPVQITKNSYSKCGQEWTEERKEA